jgi:hypothetical protein
MNPHAQTIALIVEGQGEQEALPILIRRIAEELAIHRAFSFQSFRQPASRLRKPAELEKQVEFAARKIGRDGAILILLDCDDGCPAREAPELLRRARSARSDMAISVVLAKREFETWFVAAAESLAGKHDFPPDLAAPGDPESIRGAKEWLGDRMNASYGYRATIHQAKLTACFDIHAARRSDSFDKFYREIQRLILA